jgi:UPF0755 protein
MALSRGSKGFLFVLFVVVGGLVGAWFSFTSGDAPADGPAEGEQIIVDVPEGLAASQVADLLEERGVITSAMGFRLAARFDDRSSRLRPGTYELEAGMSSDELLEILSTAPEGAEVFRVTIPEGLTVDETLQRLADAGPHSVEDYQQALSAVALPEWVPVADLPEEAVDFEGLLFPDTYDFRVNDDPQQIIAALVAQTETMLDDITPPEGYDRYDVLTVASLIERETRVADEQPVVASVIYNRLVTPMRLQIDATVQYARGEHTDRVLFEDLAIQSLWNTYETDGLPPTPISNAGRGAISAAASPAQTDFLFYVVADLETGEHAFATTNSEHNANVAEYRRLVDEAEAAEDG